MLDLIHNHGLRFALVDVRTSPVSSLYIEADEQSLYSHREKLSLQYALRLAANPSNPAHGIIYSYQNMLIYMNRSLKLLNYFTSEFHHS